MIKIIHIHLTQPSLRHDITNSSELEIQTLDDQSISSRDLSTLGEKKKMIRKKKLVRFLTTPVVRLYSEAVSRRPREGGGSGLHWRKRPV